MALRLCALTGWGCWLLGAAAALLLCGAAGAQDASLEMGVTDSRVYAGEEVLFIVRLSNTDPGSEPRLDPPEGVTLRFLTTSEQSSTFIGPGGRRTSRQINYQYIMRVSSPGEFTIPGASVTLGDGTVLRASDFTFIAEAPVEVDGFDLVAEPSKTEIYAGERTSVRLVWYLSDVASNAGFGDPALPPAMRVTPVRLSTRSPEAVQVEMFGQPATGVSRRETRDGRRVTAVFFEVSLVIGEAGEYEFPSLEVGFETRDARGRPLRGVTRSEPFSVRVLPLPAEGRPGDFGGAIGRYAARVEASPTDVAVGDPISVTLVLETISGDAAEATPPELGELRAFDGFKLDPQGWREAATGEPTVRRYTTSLRAASADVDSIPPMRLAFFDPEAGEYRVAETASLPLSVRAVRTLSAADGVGDGGGVAGRAGAEPERGRGVVALRDGPWAPVSAGAALRSDALAVLGEPVGFGGLGRWLALVLPPVLFAVLVLAAVARRGSDGATRARHRRLRDAERAGGRDPARAARLLVSAVHGGVPESVTAWDVRRRLGAMSREDAEVLAAAVEGRAVPEGARRSVRALARLIRRGL